MTEDTCNNLWSGLCGIASGCFVLVAAAQYSVSSDGGRPVGDPAVALYHVGAACFWLLAAIYCQPWAKK